MSDPEPCATCGKVAREEACSYLAGVRVVTVSCGYCGVIWGQSVRAVAEAWRPKPKRTVIGCGDASMTRIGR